LLQQVSTGPADLPVNQDSQSTEGLTQLKSTVQNQHKHIKQINTKNVKYNYLEVQEQHKPPMRLVWPPGKQEAQLPLRNRVSATYFFVAKLISVAHSCL